MSDWLLTYVLSEQSKLLIWVR